MATPLRDQILAKWGHLGDWNASGVDRAAELARMFQERGITDLSQLGLAQREFTMPGEEIWGNGDNGIIGYGDPYQAKKNVLTYGGQDFGYFGGRGGGVYDQFLADTDKGTNEFAWSADGHGNVGYRALTNPDGSFAGVAPVWGSSSDADLGRDALKMAALVYGGAQLGGALGAGGAASGTGGASIAGGSTIGNLVQTAGGVADAAKKVGITMDLGWKDWLGLGISGFGALTQNAASKRMTDAQRDIADAAQKSQDWLLGEQIRIADSELAFNKQVYEEGKQRQLGIDEINKEAIGLNMDLARKAGQRADQSWDFYQAQGRPMVEKAFKDASEYDSESNLRRVAAEAQAGVQSSFDNAQAQNNRMLARMGITPNSGKFASLNNQMAIQKAAALAGAGNGAMEQRRQGGIQLRQQTANLAQGFPAQSLSQGGQSSSASATGANIAGAGGAQARAGDALAIQGMVQGAGIYGQAAGQYGDRAQVAYNNLNQANATNAANMAGWGQLAGYSLWGGGYKDGGMVKGPGTGTSDSVPAVNTDNGQRIQLSNGEFVLPADVVRAVGTKHLQGLIDKYHQPRNLGSAR